MRIKKTIKMVEEVQQAASNRRAQITAKRISDNYKKMRCKHTLPNLATIADAESVVYNDDRNISDVRSNRGAAIPANKIRKKYKKMTAKYMSLPFDLDEIEQAFTENCVNDTDLTSVNLNKIRAIAAIKIRGKYKKIRQKRKRSQPAEPVEIPIKR